MASKLRVGGDVADKHFPLRTTERIFNLLLSESGDQQESVNVVINQVLNHWANRKEAKMAVTTKPKK